MGIFKGKRKLNRLILSKVKASTYCKRKRPINVVSPSPFKSPLAKRTCFSKNSSTPFKSPRPKLQCSMWPDIDSIVNFITKSPGPIIKRKRVLFSEAEKECDHDDIGVSLLHDETITNDSEDDKTNFGLNTNDEFQDIIKMLPSALENLSEVNQEKTLTTFIRLVHENKFPLTNIAFTLWSETVKWYDLSDTRQMRYLPDTQNFFWVGWKLFGGRFIRFMSGLRNETSVLLGETKLDPQNSKINFACPSENILRSVNPMGDSFHVEDTPGLMHSMIRLKADMHNDNNSYILMVDGKKVRMGGDVDLLGFEKGETIKDRIEIRNANIATIDNAVHIFQMVTDFKVDETPLENRDQIMSTLKALHKMFSVVLYKLRELKKTKKLNLSRLKDKAGENWRSSKFVLAIDLCYTLLYKIDNAIEKALSVIKILCKTGAHLNQVGHLFSTSPVIDLYKQPNVRLLKSPDVIKQETNSDVIECNITKQRSDEWFDARKNKRVTGSSLYGAIGCDSLKKQKEHFDRVMSGIQPDEPSNEQKIAMERGTKSEVHQIATLSSVVLPFLYPNLLYYEEGFYVTDDILVSPDGSVRSEDTIQYAFEGKAPMDNIFTTPIHYQVPERYITQTMFEQRAIGATEGTIYMSWSPESCTLFLVQEDQKLCDDITSEIQNVYFSRIPRRPSRLSAKSKLIKQELAAASKRCIFLGEFPSVEGIMCEPRSQLNNDNSPYFLPATPHRQAIQMSYDEVLRSLMHGKEVVNEVFDLQRQMASQVVVVLLADLDRLWKSEEPHAVPVMYFFRGYSLSMDIMRNLMEKCKEECRRNGIDITVSAADGEFLPLMVRGKKNQPLTLHQLSKDLWAETNKMTKSQLIQKITETSKTYSYTSHLILLTGLDGNQYRAVSIDVTSNNECVRNIRTPSKGWNVTRRAASSIDIDMNEEEETSALSETHQQQEPIISDDDVIQNALKQTHRTENIDEAENEDLDETVLYNAQEYDQTVNSTGKLTLTQSDISDILHLLQTCNQKKWGNFKSEDLRNYFTSADSLIKKFIVKELIEITKYLKVKPQVATVQLKMGNGVTKIDLVNELSKLLCDGSTLEKKTVQRRTKTKNIAPLKELAARAVAKKSYPKQVLSIAYCQYVWPLRVKEWRQSNRVGDTIDVIGLDRSFAPYYVPEYEEHNQDFHVFVYDKTHLGSNLRKALCLNVVEGISKHSWERVARANPDILNPVFLEVSEEGKILDQMKEKLAKNMFSNYVEEKMVENGDEKEATFCRIIRNALYVADDDPGIPAIDRCRHRLALIDWLQENVDFGIFPPYGSRIKGLSYILYEGLRSSQEAKLYLYAIANQGTYCVRAPNTLCSESFFSTMQEMDPWGQGVLTTAGVQKHIKEFTMLTALKMKDERSFYIKTKKDAAYPNVTLDQARCDHVLDQQDDENGNLTNMCICRVNKFISCIKPRDHFFDKKERARLGKCEKPYAFKQLNEPTRGELPIRSQYGYKINESKILPSKRLGINLDGN